MHALAIGAPFLPASGKKSKIIACLPLPLTLAIACIYSGAAQALPQNPSVTSGAVSVTTADRAMQINQTTNKAIIDWQKFGIAPNESVTFNQPSRSSVVLNRVTGAEASALDGALNATGQVFLVNPNGVLIGSAARVNVGGLFATTLDIENQRFLANDYTFTARSATDKAPVANDGAITAVDGGYIVMLANNVRNNGTIDAPSGHVLMGAGSQATLYISEQSLLGYRIDTGSAAALVENLNTIRATGGQVTLAARGLTGASQLASAAVNNSGIIEAQSLNGQPGAIVLSADMDSGRVSVTGKLDASAQTGSGGTIDTSASVVSIASNASVSTASLSGPTGLWTITAVNPLIGGNQDNISNTALNSALDNSNVTISATRGGANEGGILSVDGEIAAQGRNKLVLKAENNLLINAPVNVGSGGLAVYADSNGTGEGKVIVATDARIHASDGAPIDIYTNVPSYKDTTGYDGFITSPYRLWMLVNNVRQLQDTQTNLSGNYALGRDINAIETMSWNGGAGFMPIGSSFQGDFKGRFDGQNHVIYNLTINRPELSYVGLVGISEGDIRNLGLVDANVRGARVVGTFVGQNNGNLENVYATGNIQGGDAGGLVGINGQGFTSNGRISNAYSAVNVRGIDGLADLLNQKLGAGDDPYEIYAERMGGIASLNQGVIDSVYATGKVTLNSIYNKYSRAGGIVGYNYYGAKISNAYWATDGTGQSAIAGINNGTIDATSLANSLTNETLKTAALAFDFNNIWFRYDGYTAPLLRSFLKPLTISGVSRQIDKVYDGRAYAYQENFLYSSPEAASFAHLNSRSGATSGSQGEDVGTYTSGSATTFWSDQQGYLIQKPIVNQSTTVMVSARPITVQASSDTKSFDNSDASSSSPGVSGIKNEQNLGLVNGDTLDASQLFDSNETGERALIISALKIKDSAGKDVTSNYQVSRKGASGKIVAIKPDPNPNPNPNPSPDPSPAPDPLPVPPPGVAPASGGNPPTDQPVGGDQGGIGGPSGFPVAGTDPAVVSGGLTSEPTGERPVLPAGSNGEQQHHFPPFAYIATQDEDERMKKSLRNKKIKNDYTFSIRNGGIQVPGEIVHAD